jgi:hypothetical protein
MEPVGAERNRRGDELKRGRPCLLAPPYEAELASMARVTSTRGVHAHHYATVAARALFDLEQPGWVPRDPAFAHFVKRNGDLKWTVLSELGRISDGSVLAEVARLVGEQRLTTGDAVALIRRLRLGHGRPTR